MRLFIVMLVGLAAIASAHYAVGQEAARPGSTSTFDEQMEAASEAADAGDYTEAASRATAITRSPEFRALSDEARYLVWSWLGVVRLQGNDALGSHEALREATTYPQASGEIWRVRVGAASAAGAHDDTIASLTTVARRYPSELSEIEESDIVRAAYAGRRPDARDRRFDLVDALDDAGWGRTDPYVTSELWRDQALAWLERGSPVEANRLSERIVDPEDVVAVRIDRRFEPLLTANPNRWDVAAAAARRLTAARRQSEGAPRSLEKRNHLIEMLLLDWQFEAGLSLASETVQADLPASFDDPDQVNWTRDLRARALRLLGRTEAALAERREAATQAESGADINVSQRLNLAVMLGRQGRHREALDAVAGMDRAQASAYGLAVAEATRACAAHELGERETAEQALTWLRANAGDARHNLDVALACTGREDELATLIRTRLEDPDLRLEELLTFQGWRGVAARDSADEQRRLVMERVRQRTDVREVALRYGRIETFPIMRDTF